MTLSWQMTLKIIQHEKALKRALLSDPEIREALVHYINSFDLPGQVKAKIKTPTEAAQQFYTIEKQTINQLISYANEKAKQYMWVHEQPIRELQVGLKKQPQDITPLKQDDYSITQNYESARTNPDSLTSEEAVVMESMDFKEMRTEIVEQLSAETKINETKIAQQAVPQPQPQSAEEQQASGDSEEKEKISSDTEKGAAILAGLEAISEGTQGEFESAAEKFLGTKGAKVEGFENKMQADIEEEVVAPKSILKPPEQQQEK